MDKALESIRSSEGMAIEALRSNVWLHLSRLVMAECRVHGCTYELAQSLDTLRMPSSAMGAYVAR